jgi:aryl carrier-like protein
VNITSQIGTGKPQAGLLIELKDPSLRDDALLKSIWTIVKQANALSIHKDQLQRDYITFAEPDKPFIRTDKGTVKRRATLALYADYIERFYDSRNEDSDDAFTVDTSSIKSVMDSIRNIFGSLLTDVHEISPHTDMFSLGLDSLLVFRIVKTIRTATGLRDQLAPRHLYANPTLAKFSAAIARLAAEAGKTNGPASDDLVNDDIAKMRRMIDKHKARLSFKLNPFDYVNPNHYMGLTFFFTLRNGVTFEQAFVNLQEGLRRTMQLIPALDGKMMVCSEQEIGYKKGDLCVTIPHLPPSTSSYHDRTESIKAPRQLVYKDLSEVLPSFEKLQNAGFLPSAFKDDLVLRGDPFPPLPADILIAQANFVEGGCILAANFNHCCLDGIGVMIALKVWAESCRYLQGDMSATCSWLDSECFNHSLPEIIHEQEGYARPAQEIDPGVWGFLPFVPLEENPVYHINGTVQTEKSCFPKERALPPPPVFPHKFIWPPTPAQNGLSTTMFLIPPEKVQRLKQDVSSDPVAKGVITSISDIVQAFFWRSAIKARYRVAKELRGETFEPDEISVLELPIDGRPYFSSLLPSSYMGSMLILNRPNMPIETLCSPDTCIGHVAYILREAAARITPSLVHDAFTLLKSLPDHSRFTIADMGLESMHAMISNLMLFQMSELVFGGEIFANGGSPEAMRPQIERGHKRFRFLVIYPVRRDGGVELVLGTSPEELEMFQTDKEFTKYATLIDSC